MSPLRPARVRTGALVALSALALGACREGEPATFTPSPQLTVSLDGRWRSARGPIDLPVRGAAGAFTVERTLTLPASWTAADRAVLRARGYGWRVRASIDGAEVGSDVGGLRPIRIDLTGALQAGEQRLGLAIESPEPDTLWPGQRVPSVLPFTYAQPRPGAVLAHGELWLELGGPQTVDRLTVRAEGAELVAEAGVTAPDGARVRFEIVRDGRVLGRLPDAEVRGGRAASRGAWTGPRWTIGGAETPSLQYLVARLDDGSARQVRFGARDVRRVDDHLTLDGQRLYLTGERISPPGDPRQALATLVKGWSGVGFNAIELHGQPVSAALLDAADELGLAVLHTPFCDGRRREAGTPVVDDTWARYVYELSSRVALDEAAHPSVLLWSLEAHPQPRYPTLYQPFFASSIPAVDLEDAVGYNPQAYEEQRRSLRLPPLIIELAYPMPADGPSSLLGFLDGLLGEHAPAGMGMVFPDLLPEDLATSTPVQRQYAEGLSPILASRSTPRLESGSRRGPGALRVEVLRGGTAAEGVVVVLEAPGQAPLASLSDARGWASFELDYEGPVRVRTLDDAATAELSLQAGRYEDGRWEPATAAARLALP